MKIAVIFSTYSARRLNVNKKFIVFDAETLDTGVKMYYIIGVRISTLTLQVLKSAKI
jgi:hypothetical protein